MRLRVFVAGVLGLFISQEFCFSNETSQERGPIQGQCARGVERGPRRPKVPWEIQARERPWEFCGNMPRTVQKYIDQVMAFAKQWNELPNDGIEDTDVVAAEAERQTHKRSAQFWLRRITFLEELANAQPSEIWASTFLIQVNALREEISNAAATLNTLPRLHAADFEAPRPPVKHELSTQELVEKAEHAARTLLQSLRGFFAFSSESFKRELSEKEIKALFFRAEKYKGEFLTVVAELKQKTDLAHLPENKDEAWSLAFESRLPDLKKELLAAQTSLATINSFLQAFKNAPNDAANHD